MFGHSFFDEEGAVSRIRRFTSALLSGAVFKTAFAGEAAKGAPAVLGSVGAVVTQSFWIGLATFIYIVVQIVYLLRKWHREETDWRGQKKPKNE